MSFVRSSIISICTFIQLVPKTNQSGSLVIDLFTFWAPTGAQISIHSDHLSIALLVRFCILSLSCLESIYPLDDDKMAHSY